MRRYLFALWILQITFSLSLQLRASDSSGDQQISPKKSCVVQMAELSPEGLIPIVHELAQLQISISKAKVGAEDTALISRMETEFENIRRQLLESGIADIDSLIQKEIESISGNLKQASEERRKIIQAESEFIENLVSPKFEFEHKETLQFLESASSPEIHLSPDGRTIVVHGSRNIELFNLVTKKSLYKFESPKTVYAVSWHPSSSEFAFSDAEGAAHIVTVKNGSKRVLNPHAKPIRSLNYSPDGKSLVTGSDDGTAKIINLKNPSNVQIFEHNIGAMVSRAWLSFDLKTLITTTNFANLHFRDLQTGKLTIIKEVAVDQVAFSPDGKKLITYHIRSNPHLVDLDSRRTFPLVANAQFAEFTSDGTQVLVAGWNGEVSFFEVDSGVQTGTIYSTSKKLAAVFLLPGHNHVILIEQESGILNVIDKETGEIIQSLSTAKDTGLKQISRAQISPDGKHIIMLEGNHLVLLRSH